MRMGIGYDIHPLVAGRKLVLGGVELDFPRGLSGHSDADVLIHAVCDALLGAAGEGDIGKHFPDTDDRYRGISSLKLLEKVKKIITEKGFTVENIDSTVILEEPRLASRSGEMAGNVARALEIEAARVNVKATTSEGFGAAGRGEAIAALAIASLKDQP
jgi:2-C-methyl-D-erythritol 2,4-cyclodiphosphate synthase